MWGRDYRIEVIVMMLREWDKKNLNYRNKEKKERKRKEKGK